MAKYAAASCIPTGDSFDLDSDGKKQLRECVERNLKQKICYDIKKHIEITSTENKWGEELWAEVFIFSGTELKDFVANIQQEMTDEVINLLKNATRDLGEV